MSNKNNNQTQNYAWQKECHIGNNLVFEKDGVSIYAGGHTREAEPDVVNVVIDLDNNVRSWKNGLPTSWKSTKLVPLVLSMPIVDYSAPWGASKEFWLSLWDDLKSIAPCSVLVMCMGGHGRTGLVVTCLMMAAELDVKKENPILWLRKKYCDKAVESQKQLIYLNQLWDIPVILESKPPYTNNKNESNTKKGNSKECFSCDSKDKSIALSSDIDKYECDDCWKFRGHKENSGEAEEEYNNSVNLQQSYCFYCETLEEVEWDEEDNKFTCANCWLNNYDDNKEKGEEANTKKN
jgi:hypothetical protein